jgi:NADPH:quinone reductase
MFEMMGTGNISKYDPKWRVKTMRGWIIEKLANPNEALNLVELQEPSIAPRKVKIHVKAVALNYFDILQCQGKYQENHPLPFTPGAEISGIIIEVGAGSSFKVGQKVIAMPKLPSGGLAERVVVPDDVVYPIPEQMTFQTAASLFITYQTSYYALHHRARLQPGEVLLVHAGSGGVGSAAIQLGRATGARVIATAGGLEKTQICRNLGAEIVIDYLSEDFVEIVKKVTDGRGADVIYDPVGGDVFDRSRKCIAFDGRLLVIGFTSGRIADAPTNHILVKNYSVVGVHYGLFNKLKAEGAKEIHDRLMDLYEKGHINPLIYKEFPFEEVPQALESLGSRKTWGKLVTRLL